METPVDTPSTDKPAPTTVEVVDGWEQECSETIVRSTATRALLLDEVEPPLDDEDWGSEIDVLSDWDDEEEEEEELWIGDDEHETVIFA